MQKIMFNDKCSLMKAVIELFKEMTRREPIFEELKNPRFEFDTKGHLCLYEGDVLVHRSRFALNEEVAVAQSYKNFYGEFKDPLRSELINSAGFFNKMFVKAEFMPHAIRITDIKVERLQDISEEDCLKEGIYYYETGGIVIGYPFPAPFYYTFPNAVRNGNPIHWTTPRKAFSALIDKVNGRGTWERNPWVFAYSFELIK